MSISEQGAGAISTEAIMLREMLRIGVQKVLEGGLVDDMLAKEHLLRGRAAAEWYSWSCIAKRLENVVVAAAHTATRHAADSVRDVILRSSNSTLSWHRSFRRECRL